MDNNDKLFISALLHKQDIFLNYLDYVSEVDFEDPDMLTLYKCAHNIYVSEGANKLSKRKIVNQLSLNKWQLSDTSLIDDVLKDSFSQEETRSLFLQFKRRSIVSRYIDLFSDLKKYVSTSDEALTKLVSKVETEILSVSVGADNDKLKIIDLPKGLKSFIHNLTVEPGLPSIDLGFSNWQHRIGGVRNATVSFIAATMKAGKSQLAVNFAVAAAKLQKIPVLYIDTELNDQMQKIRLAGILSGIPYSVLESGLWKKTKEDMQKDGSSIEGIHEIEEYANRLNDQTFWDISESLPISYISVPGLPFEEVIPIMRRWVLTKAKPNFHSKVPECLIIYDYLKLANLDELRDGVIKEYQLHGLNYQMLHDFAKLYNLPIIAFGQTNNMDGETTKSIAGSKKIGENVSSVSLFVCKDDMAYAADPNGSHYMKILVSRFGPGTPGSYINLDAQLDKGKFEERSLGTVDFVKLRREANMSRRQKAGDDDD